MKMRKMRAKLSLLVLVSILMGSVFVAATLYFSSSAAASTESEANAIGPEETSSSHFISLYVDNEQINVRSGATTVREALARANITLNDGDKVEPALDEEIASDDFNINIYRAHDVIVLDGNHKRHIKTANTNPEDIVTDAGVELLEADTVSFVPYDGLLESGNVAAYKVIRAKTVHVNLYGEKLEIRTQAKTIKKLLKDQKIDTDSEKNWISMSLDTEIKDGLSFSVQPQGIQTITVKETIKYNEKVTQDYDVEYGKRQVTKAGENGSKTVTYEVNMKDGVELSRRKLSEVVTKAPVTQEVKVGMKLNLPAGSHEQWMAAAGISAGDYGYVNFIISHESGWRPNASNGRYFGLYQTSKARLVSDCGANWVNDPVCQLRSATGYATSRYGSWSKAYNVWRNQHWW